MFAFSFCVINTFSIYNKRIKIVILYLDNSDNIYNPYTLNLIVYLKTKSFFSLEYIIKEKVFYININTDEKTTEL